MRKLRYKRGSHRSRQARLHSKSSHLPGAAPHAFSNSGLSPASTVERKQSLSKPSALHSPQIAAPTSGDGSLAHSVSPDSHWGHLVLAKSSQAGHFSPVKGCGAVGPRVSARLCLYLALWAESCRGMRTQACTCTSQADRMRARTLSTFAGAEVLLQVFGVSRTGPALFHVPCLAVAIHFVFANQPSNLVKKSHQDASCDMNGEVIDRPKLAFTQNQATYQEQHRTPSQTRGSVPPPLSSESSHCQSRRRSTRRRLPRRRPATGRWHIQCRPTATGGTWSWQSLARPGTSRR